ncbi:hypothetical protein N7474_005878 [Penicillium riverlandense]|uniref:uncharacterized protein n=1 Tax=Penicillium riverlandense TaxID=1903569 RepID=UPI00254787E9|nr:uncharacterized protein N7474_005878 [Penicillium riverlandense]KAJ5820287.1 hypothetical protein N7474_005878 [Penicillium riverlandense]
MTSRITLLEPVLSLCNAFTTHAPVSTLLSTFTTQPTPLVHEHGLPQLAPFLGHSFSGTDGVARYFELLADLLEITAVTFEPDDNWLVDDACMCVSLRGSATFKWKATGQAWDETFMYRLALATDVSSDPGKKGRLLVWEYRVWADTGAAYLARMGRLGELVTGEVGKGKGVVEGIHVPGLGDDVQKDVMGETETRSSRDRKRSGCQDVLGEGLNVYGSCG